MSRRKSRVPTNERLRASPNYALTFTLDGSPYIAKDSEPYIQYWLSERYRILLSMFSKRGGATVDDAQEGYFRLTRAPRNAAENKRLAKAIDDMQSAGVLIGSVEDTSRYTAKIVGAYIKHRPFPKALSDWIISHGAVQADTRVLDLAGGPGDLALALAAASNHVSLMDLSKGFVKAAAGRAKQLGRNLTAVHDSCNRLMYRDERYNVVTISQALHWLDDVMVCRGLCRCLEPQGSFFVVQGAFEVDDGHPLSYILGRHSILGPKSNISFSGQVQALLKRLTLLFDALDAPDVQRVDLAQQSVAAGSTVKNQIVPVTVSTFLQYRPLDAGFLRAFLTPEHIQPTGLAPEMFWKDVERRCSAATAEQLIGRYDWAILQFQRGGTRMDVTQVNSHTAKVIPYDSM